MSITGSEQWMYSSGREFYDFPLEQSLRFNDNDTAYLSRTNSSSPTNNKKGTLSVWLKRGHIGDRQYIIHTGTGASNDTHFDLHLSTANQLNCGMYSVGPFTTSQVFRDVSAWFHLVFAFDSAQAVASDRRKLYINGVQVTDFASNTDIPLNTNWAILNSGQVINIGRHTSVNDTWDGYMAEFNLIDGQALDASSFGEFKSNIWIPRDTSGLTYGNNGFRLNFADTVTASGFNTVTWTGNNTNGGNSVNAVGFSPDLVWAKCRSVAYSPLLYDSIRGTGATAELKTDGTEAEGGSSSSERGYLNSFDSDGFSSVVGSNGDNLYFNQSGQTYVAWCWDAGSGSAASNTDGSITSTVKANTDYGFSIVSYTGNATAGATVGHGLNTEPSMVIVKNRTSAGSSWCVSHTGYPTTQTLYLDSTTSVLTRDRVTARNTSTFTVGSHFEVNGSGNAMIAYCFAEKTGFSKFGSYTGTGATGNSITTGFRPAFIMIKRTDAAFGWYIYDTTRQVQNPMGSQTDPLVANTSGAEGGADTSWYIDVTDTGFTINNTSLFDNASGGTYLFMAFKDTRDAAFWRDVSGQGNDWQHNNLTFSDVVPDGTNNFAVLNNLDNISTTYSEGNLKISQSSYNYNSRGSFGLTSGKYYWEVRMDSTHGEFGVCENGKMPQTDPQGAYPAYFIYNNGSTGVIYNNATSVSSSSATMTNWAAGDVAMIAYDADNGNLYHGLNGVWQNSADPAAGTGAIITGITTQFGGSLVPFFGSGTASARNWVVNFGQDSTFAGAVAAGGNADENGLGDFAHPVPSGFLSLCSSNLPKGAIDTLADETPEDYFNTVLFDTQSGSYPKSITGVGFQPDLVWGKSRSQAYPHYLFDVVRGTGLTHLSSNSTAAEGYDGVTDLDSFDADGFTIGAGDGLGFTNGVAWNWKAGGTGVSNTDGSITSTVSVAETSQGNKWFSVVKWTGNGTAGATVGHGLSSQPRLIITKNMSVATDWSVLAQDANNGSGHLGYIRLNLNSAWAATSILWNNTEPTSSVFTLGSYSYVNGSGNDIIGYCFANAEGLCKVGSYTGNGSTDGTFVFTGHKPSFLLIKRTDAADNWDMHDSTRGPYNVNDWRLYANQSSAEASGGSFGADFLSNGFKLRTTNAGWNASGGSYIFLSISEQPFKYANAR